MEALRDILLLLILFCAVCVSLTRDTLSAVILFMASSSAMCVVWILLAAPDLAITEAAVGAGVTSIMMFMALKKVNGLHKGGKDDEKR